jgi:hypothetical protein
LTSREDNPNPEPVSICFQFVTKGGAVVDSEPETWDSIEKATAQAKDWMELPEQKTIHFITFEGHGAVVRAGDIEHTAVIPKAKMVELYESYRTAAAEQNQEKSS